MADNNALQRLREIGAPVDRLSPAQVDALGSLADAEVDVLIRIHERLNGAGGEVEGFEMGDPLDSELIGSVIF
jgi:hypothetical protein